MRLFIGIVAVAIALSLGPSSSTVAAAVVDDLTADFNNPLVLSLIDQNLPSGIKRTSGIQLAWMPWGFAPGPVKSRATKPHSVTDPVIRISIRVHVNTPWWCLAVDGSVIYYLFPDNTGFHFKGLVDSWDTLTDLISACSGGVNDQMRKVVPAKIPLIQSMVDFRLSQLPNQHFSSYYLLPPWTGSVNDNDHVTLVLVP